MTAEAAESKKTGLQRLREPFAEHQISTKPQPTKKDNPKGRCPECGGWHGLPAIHLSYVGHAALTDRLLECDEHWTWEPLSYGPDGLPMIDQSGGMWIKLTVCGLTRLGYGDAQGKTGPDAMKERIGDALRNAAMRFGAALDLWHKGDLHGSQNDDDESAGSGAQGKSPKLATLASAKKGGETPDAPVDMAIVEQMNSTDSVPELVKIMSGLTKEQKAAVNETFNRRMGELKKAA
ncbi:hypothetical protein [Paraburkholderia sp. RL18-085-BIA-A]|uniref:hypothetical protein n=1 Tax=Paraburkholderia sp. RL18-085-BIA-A TaxID=3031633 RepID=UPI0038B73A4C